MNSIKLQSLIESVKSFAKNDPNILAVIHYGSSLNSSVFHDIDICLVPSPDISESIDQLRLRYTLKFEEIFDFQVFDALPLYILVEVMKGKILILKNYDLLFNKFFETNQKNRTFSIHYQNYLQALLDG